MVSLNIQLLIVVISRIMSWIPVVWGEVNAVVSPVLHIYVNGPDAEDVTSILAPKQAFLSGPKVDCNAMESISRLKES